MKSDDDPAIGERSRAEGVRPAQLVQLFVGLILFGVSMALVVRSELGLSPWDVFHQGLAVATGLTIGVCTILVGVVVLLLWIPIHQRPGIGTIANVIVIGLTVDGVLLVLPFTDQPVLRWTYLVAGIVLNGIATGLYIGAGLGPGPRDGLMVGLARDGRSIRVVRTAIEVTVLIIGWLLGGTVGIGTVLFALAIGPIVHLTLPAFDRRRRSSGVEPA